MSQTVSLEDTSTLTKADHHTNLAVMYVQLPAKEMAKDLLHAAATNKHPLFRRLVALWPDQSSLESVEALPAQPVASEV